MRLILDPTIINAFPIQTKLFDQIMQLKGEVVRELENRCTQRIILGNKSYFIKQHHGVGWKEIFKNILQLRLPVISAKNEWLALKLLQELNIATATPVGFGIRGLNPAKCQSFLLTKELPAFITLEDLGKDWQVNRPSFRFKQKIIQEVARIARILHENGVNHRDFYICHFLLDLAEDRRGFLKIYLLDLHRAQIRKFIPSRWRIKDLAGLYFSSKDIGLTQNDLLRFLKLYHKSSLREVLYKETTFWQKVKKRGDKLYSGKRKK